MLHSICLGILLCVVGSYGLYDSTSDVVELTPNNFDRLVTNSDEVWIVEFFAPWCGHCKNLVPEYKKTARALKGIAKVGAVDADEHKSFTQKYGVTGFPTIKIFTGSKHSPYQGQRNAEAFVDAALKAAKEKAYDSLGKKASSSSDKVNTLKSLNDLIKLSKPVLRTTDAFTKKLLYLAKNSSSLSDGSDRSRTFSAMTQSSKQQSTSEIVTEIAETSPMTGGSSRGPINDRKANFLKTLHAMLQNYKPKK